MIRLSFTYRSICHFFVRMGFLLLAVTITAPAVIGQSCASGADLDVPTRNAVEGTARKFLDMSTRGDVAGLKANSIPAIAGDFGSIEQAVVTNKQYFVQGPATISGTYLLDASRAKGPLPRADFYCGIYNSPDRLVFSISNLPPGRYALAMQKIAGKDPITLTLILQDVSGSWKLAGYYPRLDAIGGHDGPWYLTKAREYKAKGQVHNAWFYYLTAWDLMAPVNFMSTPQLDKVAEEMQGARPSDLPGNGNPLNLAANGKTFQVTEMVAVPVENNLDLRVGYETADASNTGLAFQDNMAVSKAIVAKYPEVRDAFSAVIARAVDASGHDYGSVLPMKDIK
ncbi:MAG TPA: hypothetical protein VII95_10335 [Terriglobales bacterium]|jgi:hypothetical protein